MPYGVGPGELVILLVIIGLPLLLLYLVVRALRQGSPEAVAWAPSGPSQAVGDPRAVLAERLARGEITRNEFDTAMRALGFVDAPS